MARPKQFVVCLGNKGYRASLVVRRIYETVPDADASKHGLIRVIDESGEGYLFPEGLFEVLELPSGLRRKLAMVTQH